MPVYTEKASASHRPVLPLPTYMLLQKIGLSIDHGEEGEPPPSEDAIRTAMSLLAQIPFRIIGNPTVTPFFGEVHVTWQYGNRQVVLMAFPNRTALVHHYPNEIAENTIEEATPASVSHWLGWLSA